MSKSKQEIKTIENLEAGDCRWPIGDPRQADFHFCGGHKKGEGPYCAQHSTMAFEPSKQRPQASSPSFALRRAA